MIKTKKFVDCKIFKVCVHTARFLEYIWPFFNIMYEGVNKVFLKFCKIHRKTPAPATLGLPATQAEACNFIKKETMAQVLSCEFCEISKNTFSTEHLRATGFVSFMFYKNFMKYLGRLL